MYIIFINWHIYTGWFTLNVMFMLFFLYTPQSRSLFQDHLYGFFLSNSQRNSANLVSKKSTVTKSELLCLETDIDSVTKAKKTDTYKLPNMCNWWVLYVRDSQNKQQTKWVGNNCCSTICWGLNGETRVLYFHFLFPSSLNYILSTDPHGTCFGSAIENMTFQSNHAKFRIF